MLYFYLIFNVDTCTSVRILLVEWWAQLTWKLEQGKTSPPSGWSCHSLGAVAGGASTLVHVDVGVGHNVSIETQQFNGAIARTDPLTTGAGSLQGGCLL